MTFDDVVGQGTAVALLRRALAAGRLPHALLFQGAAGLGKSDAARALAGAIQCEAGGDDACGGCAACRKVERGLHPDVIWITRLPRKDGAASADGEEPDEATEDAVRAGSGLRKDILIEQVREIAEHAAFAPREGRRRVFVIEPADRMNAAAQNALLKTLEEPPETAVLVLVTARPHALLPTVRSRCLAVRFAPLGTSDLAARLEASGIPREEAVARAALAEGRARLARDLDLAARRARRDEVLDILEHLDGTPGGFESLPAFVSRLAGKDEEALHEGLDLLESLLRDAARSDSGLPPEGLVHADLRDRIARVGRRIGRRRAAALVRAAERLRDGLRFNLNRTLIAESLLVAVAGGEIPSAGSVFAPPV